MSKREWMALGAVFAVVVVAVWFEPDDMVMTPPGGHDAMVMDATMPGTPTVTLAVSGMT